MIFEKSRRTNFILLFKTIREVCPFRVFISLITILLEKTNGILFSVLLVKYIVDHYKIGLEIVNIIVIFSICGVFQIINKILSSYYYNIYVPTSNIKIEKHIRKKIYDKAVQLDLSSYDTPELYEKFNLAMSDSSARIIELYENIICLIGSIYMVITIGVIMVTIQPLLIVFVLIPQIVSSIIGKRFNRTRYDYNNKQIQNQRIRDYVNRTFYYKEYILDQKNTNIHMALFCAFTESTRELLKIIRRDSKKISLFEYIFMITSDVIVYLGCITYCVLCVFIFQVMTISGCIVIINTLNNMIGALWQIGGLYIRIDKDILFLDNYIDFLNYPITILSGSKSFAKNKKTIIFDNVNFKYPNQEKYIFENLTFEVPHGKKIAIVGINGVGKTTLIKLLLRLYDPSGGSITCGNQNIKMYNLSEYRNAFGVLFQDFHVYAFPFGNNIAMDSDYDELSAINAIKMAELQNKVNQYDISLDDMLTNDIYEDGIQFSKGEMQKLALSRLFYKDYDFIILDEPFSNLDLFSEKIIYENLKKIFNEKTMIVISHRLASITDFDKIIVIDEGRIVEEGTHCKLINEKGLYYTMFIKQTEAYRDGE